MGTHTEVGYHYGYPDYIVTEDGVHWEVFHDDSCGQALIQGRCPICGFRPDLQSKGARPFPSEDKK